MTQHPPKISVSVPHTFYWPILINSICIIGLALAFIGHGWWDILSWVSFCGFFVIVFCVYHAANKKPSTLALRHQYPLATKNRY